MRIYPFIRSVLFLLKPELAHNLTLQAIRLAGSLPPVNSLVRLAYQAPTKPVQAFGLNFINPVGLAAGYDKDGLGWRGMACLGFGHIEIGTVTPRPQPGNPQPRLFRLPEQKALINRMGFPGQGAEFVKHQLSMERPKNLVLGVNIGKNKDTPIDTAEDDYLYLLRYFSTSVDYLTINVSSPNTVGLRRLQEKDSLDHMLRLVNEERTRLNLVDHRKLPILVKLAPDLSDTQLDEALDVIIQNQMDGVIASNTTISRPGIPPPVAQEAGGLSGTPLFERSLEVVTKINTRTSGQLPVIGVGGISNTTSVQKMLDAGAVLVQVYTGLLYEGPGLVKQLVQGLKI